MTRDEALKSLQEQVGQEVHVGEWLTVTQDRINQFADVSRDWQWIHIDPERARKESPYGTTVAHGFLTLSLIPYLADTVSADRPSIPGARMAINYGLNRVRFPNAVPAGARIRARTTLLSVEPVQENALQVVRRVTVEIEGQEKPACVAETVARYYFDADEGGKA